MSGFPTDCLFVAPVAPLLRTGAGKFFGKGRMSGRIGIPCAGGIARPGKVPAGARRGKGKPASATATLARVVAKSGVFTALPAGVTGSFGKETRTLQEGTGKFDGVTGLLWNGPRHFLKLPAQTGNVTGLFWKLPSHHGREIGLHGDIPSFLQKVTGPFSKGTRHLQKETGHFFDISGHFKGVFARNSGLFPEFAAFPAFPNDQPPRTCERTPWPPFGSPPEGAVAPHPHMRHASPGDPGPLVLAANWDEAVWDHFHWDSDPPSPNPKPEHKHNTMKQQKYYRVRIGDQIVWLRNFQVKLPTYADILHLDPAAVTAILLDVATALYALQTYRGALATANTAIYQRIEDALNNDTVAGNIVWIGFTPPSGAPAPVAYGALKRVFAYINGTIKKAAAYDDAIGRDLGTEGAEKAEPDAATTAPEFDIRGTAGGKAEYVWTKDEFDGVKIETDTGAAGILKDIDLRPNYTLNWLPPAGTSVIIKARLRYIYKGEDFGNWSPWQQWTLTGE